MLGGEGEKLGQALLDVFSDKSTRDAARGQIRSRQRATEPTRIGEQVRDARGITMGQRSVPTRADLGAAPEPEFPVPAGSPAIRRLQQLRREIGPMQGPRESTSADYIFQPAIRGMRNPAGTVAPGTMFSSTGRVTEPGTRIGGRMMAGEYPSSPRRTVVRETEVEVSPGQLELPLDFRSNREVMSEFDPMTAPGMGGRKSKDTSGVITEFDPSALVRSPGGRLSANDIARMRAEQDPMRPIGVQVVDLDELYGNTRLPGRPSVDPKQARNIDNIGVGLAAAGGLAGAGALNVGIGELIRRGINNASSPEGEVPSTGGGGSLPEAMTPEESGALNTDIENKLAATQQSDPVAGSVMRAMAPKSPEQYANIGDYYADRARFVRSLQPKEEGSEFQAIVDAIKTTAANEEMAGNLAAFARANPQMAYENMVRQGLLDERFMPREFQPVVPEMNQQSDAITSLDYGSALGTNNEANAVGQANAAASQMYAGEFNNDLEAAAAIQKNNELIAATAPMQYGNLQRAEDFLGQQLAARMAYRSGDYGIGGMGQ